MRFFNAALLIGVILASACDGTEPPSPAVAMRGIQFQDDRGDIAQITPDTLDDGDEGLIQERETHDYSTPLRAPVVETSEMDLDDPDDPDDPDRVSVLSNEESEVSWLLRCLGPLHRLTILLLGFMIFLGSWWVVVTQRRPAVVAAYLVFLIIPLLFGVVGTVQAFIKFHQTIAWSELPVGQNVIARDTMAALVPIFVAVTVTIPSLFVLAVGLFVKTLKAPLHKTDDRTTTVSDSSQPDASNSP